MDFKLFSQTPEYKRLTTQQYDNMQQTQGGRVKLQPIDQSKLTPLLEESTNPLDQKQNDPLLLNKQPPEIEQPKEVSVVLREPLRQNGTLWSDFKSWIGRVFDCVHTEITTINTPARLTPQDIATIKKTYPKINFDKTIMSVVPENSTISLPNKEQPQIAHIKILDFMQLPPDTQSKLLELYTTSIGDKNTLGIVFPGFGTNTSNTGKSPCISVEFEKDGNPQEGANQLHQFLAKYKQLINTTKANFYVNGDSRGCFGACEFVKAVREEDKKTAITLFLYSPPTENTTTRSLGDAFGIIQNTPLGSKVWELLKGYPDNIEYKLSDTHNDSLHPQETCDEINDIVAYWKTHKEQAQTQTYDDWKKVQKPGLFKVYHDNLPVLVKEINDLIKDPKEDAKDFALTQDGKGIDTATSKRLCEWLKKIQNTELSLPNDDKMYILSNKIMKFKQALCKHKNDWGSQTKRVISELDKTIKMLKYMILE